MCQINAVGTDQQGLIGLERVDEGCHAGKRRPAIGADGSQYAVAVRNDGVMRGSSVRSMPLM